MEESLKQLLVCPLCHAELDDLDTTLACTGCGARYSVEAGIPNMTVTRDPEQNTFDYLAHYALDAEEFDYFEERTGATAHSERRLREVIERHVPSSAKTILDVGCGSAWVAKKYLPENRIVYSLDASTVNPRKALARYPSAHHYGLAANALSLPFRDSSFDCIIAAEIIEHVPDPLGFVGELFRVLRPGGKLVISTPYKETIRYELCIHCNQKTPVNAHLHSFDEKKLAALNTSDSLEASRFSIFNNKLLLFARTYIVLRYLPTSLWLLVDKIANLVLNKPVNIVVSYSKHAA